MDEDNTRGRSKREKTAEEKREETRLRVQEHRRKFKENNPLKWEEMKKKDNNRKKEAKHVNTRASGRHERFMNKKRLVSVRP